MNKIKKMLGFYLLIIINILLIPINSTEAFKRCSSSNVYFNEIEQSFACSSYTEESDLLNLSESDYKMNIGWNETLIENLSNIPLSFSPISFSQGINIGTNNSLLLNPTSIPSTFIIIDTESIQRGINIGVNLTYIQNPSNLPSSFLIIDSSLLGQGINIGSNFELTELAHLSTDLSIQEDNFHIGLVSPLWIETTKGLNNFLICWIDNKQIQWQVSCRSYNLKETKSNNNFWNFSFEKYNLWNQDLNNLKLNNSLNFEPNKYLTCIQGTNKCLITNVTSHTIQPQDLAYNCSSNIELFKNKLYCFKDDNSLNQSNSILVSNASNTIVYSNENYLFIHEGSNLKIYTIDGTELIKSFESVVPELYSYSKDNLGTIYLNSKNWKIYKIESWTFNLQLLSWEIFNIKTKLSIKDIDNTKYLFGCSTELCYKINLTTDAILKKARVSSDKDWVLLNSNIYPIERVSWKTEFMIFN